MIYSIDSIKSTFGISKDSFKINFKHILLVFCATILLLYVITTKLEINYQVFFDFTNATKNRLDFSFFDSNKNIGVNCNALYTNVTSYSIVLDGETYPKSTPLYLNKSINFECLRQSPTVKRILAWNPFFGGYSYSSAFNSKACPVTNCIFTSNKSLINQSDLVLVHMRDSIENIPKYRPWFQRWVFVLYESPVHSGDFNRYNGVFNLTSTYRIDSNFSGFYESDSNIEWKLNLSFNDSYDFYGKKSKFAAAVISNCGAGSRRLDYIREMQNYIPIDVYGRCGNSCPTTFSDSSPGDCKSILARAYKFYFAFENSICQDYITEKFFTILNYDIIPVVLGGGFYEYYVPKSGFINAQDYASPKDLANYLSYLDNNRTAYNAYFNWKKHISFLKDRPAFSPICNMCIQLRLEEHFGIRNSIIHNISSYWSRKLNCKNVNSKSFKIES